MQFLLKIRDKLCTVIVENLILTNDKIRNILEKVKKFRIF